jgi:hypothetical protein
MQRTITDDELIEALRVHGSTNKTAKALGMNRRSLDRRRKRLALKGFSPEHDMTHTVPDGFLVKGTSRYYNKHGELAGEWVKSAVDRERMHELLVEAIAAMVADLPRLPARKVAKGSYRTDLMACYPIGDPHVGMKAWAEECGKNWDLEIAERVHCGVMRDLVERAPATDECQIIELGDLFHYDSMEAKTPRSGHALDADGRYAKMIRVGIKIVRQCIETALTKHRIVNVRIVPGNHDETGALFLTEALANIYEKEPRVRIDRSPGLFSYFEFGKNLVGAHHGHTCKPGSLPLVMAADMPEAWGRTKHRYWWMGHVHHERNVEHPGCSVESFGTNAPNDAYAKNGGWRSREQSKCIILHRELGEVVRFTSHPAMLDNPI